jgi:type VI secretion system protein ImpK
MHACLALGFEGVHRTSAGGAANLQMIQRNLFETLQAREAARPRTVAALARARLVASHGWRASRCRSGRSRRSRRSRCSASISCSALLLGGNAEAAAAALLAVHPKGEHRASCGRSFARPRRRRCRPARAAAQGLRRGAAADRLRGDART